MISEMTYALMSAVAYEGNVQNNDRLTDAIQRANYRAQLSDSDELINVSPESVDDNWYVIDVMEGVLSDIQAQTWRNDVTEEVVVAFRGTESWYDFYTDAHIGYNSYFDQDKTADQQDEAEIYYDYLVGKMAYLGISDYSVSTTGHSLGGFLADSMAIDFTFMDGPLCPSEPVVVR